ncbi:MAG: phosphotransferase family protein [Acidimicrobiales bacterium]
MATPAGRADLELGPVVARLRRRGVLPPGEEVSAEPLTGGVSSVVVRLTAGASSVVVKRALPRLRVTEEWRSAPERILREAEALQWAHALRPDRVPRILDIDAEHLVISMEAAPEAWSNWKLTLLGGATDPGVAGSLGRALAAWHSASAADPTALARFADRRHFFDLRVSPFFLRVGRAHPGLAPQIDAVVDRLWARHDALVHGDFSPKNVLVGERGLWVLDWETAHRGDPSFDVAFMLSHLLCKAVHRPAWRPGYRACADAFTGAYLEASSVPIDAEGLSRLVGCLVLARVDGTSPVDYFDDPERQRARRLGSRALAEEGVEVAGLWELAGR